MWCDVTLDLTMRQDLSSMSGDGTRHDAYYKKSFYLVWIVQNGNEKYLAVIWMLCWCCWIGTLGSKPTPRPNFLVTGSCSGASCNIMRGRLESAYLRPQNVFWDLTHKMGCSMKRDPQKGTSCALQIAKLSVHWCGLGASRRIKQRTIKKFN